MEVASAVRPPSLDAGDDLPVSAGKRKRSPPSRSPSRDRHRRRTRSPDDHYDARPRSRSPPRRGGPLPRDVDHDRARERQRQFEMRQRQEEESKPALTEADKQAAAKKEFDALLNKRSGGVYIPPARLRALQAQVTDRSSKEFQRMAWEALKKSINGLINKVNVANIKSIVPELFGENLVRGRGLFARSAMKAQAASLPFTPIFAATVAIVNSKLPQVGELLSKRLVAQFRKAFKRNDKTVCISSSTFLAQLTNFQVVNELLIAQILLLLLKNPTDDSCEIAVNICKEVGQHLEEFNSAIAVAVFDQFRSILHEADIDKRTQYSIEVLFQVRKDRYKNYPRIRDELDLIDEDDMITHQIDLDAEIDPQMTLDIFKFDAEYEANEEAYKNLKAQILGEADDSDEEDDDSDESEDEEEAQQDKAMEIADQTNTDLVNLRRSIYLTIKSSGIFEEAVHKLMKINLPVGLEKELPSMIIECASQERTSEKFYSQIAERFCKLNRLWRELFEQLFAEYYETIHRFETNRLRIIAQLFGHLFCTDAIGWHCMSVIHLTQEDTTSSSRIFIKILFEEMTLGLGMNKLVEKMKDETLKPSFSGLFPKDDPKDTRFAINYFTAIQMGALTEDMREWLQSLPKQEPRSLPEPYSDSDSDSVSSYSSYSSRSRSRTRSPRRVSDRRGRRDSYSDSGSDSRSRSPPPRSRRGRSPSRGRRDSYSSRSRSLSDSRSPPRRRRNTSSPSRSRSRSPPRRRARSYTSSRSRSPPPRRRANRSVSSSRSRSRSPSPRRARSATRSPSPRRARDVARSRSPPRRRARSSSGDRSRSPPPRRGGRDRSETPQRRGGRDRSETPPRRARDDPPPRRRRNSSSDISSRAPPRRRRSPIYESERSRTPPRRRF